MSSKPPWDETEFQERSCKTNLRERLKFNSYKFDDGQTIDSHIDTLKTLACSCGFGDEQIIDKILSEYNHAKILEILDHEQNVTLERVVDLVKANDESHGLVIKTESYQEVRETSEVQQIVISKEEINTIVYSTLRDEKPKCLKELQILLEHKFHCSLSQDDKNYIEGKYTETLIELWLDEASENVMGQVDQDLLDLIEKLNSIDSLQHCFTFGSTLPYNSLMKELYNHANQIKGLEKHCILKFKSTLLTFMLLKSSYLQAEINFYKIFTRTMKRSKNVQDLCNALSVTIFLETEVDETISFKKFLQNIIYSCVLETSVDHLKAASQAIVQQEKYFFVKHVKNTIKDYLRPVILTEKSADGRKLLEVIGKHIVVAQVLADVERTPGFGEIEEIRFVNAEVIHIDEDLSSKLWHGKNIVVFADTIIVSMDRNITWDVSGQNSNSEEIEPAGTSSDGVGLEGAEGKPGESGGNILLICDEIENAPNLRIVSNGGKGGKGQDGGRGCDGKDGDYMSGIDFKKNFPPVSKWLNKSKRENLDETRTSLMSDIQTVKLSLLGDLVSVPKDDFDSIFKESIKDLNDIYFEIKTKRGCTILFSFHAPTFGFCQSFLLHKASDGEQGKEGGKGGLGGKGGFAGEVKVEVSENLKSADGGIVICANKGEDGKHGEPGVFGKPGTSGLDCAYIDSTKPKIPFLTDVQFPKYFITHPSDCQRLKVEYHTGKEPVRVYCPHNGQFAEIIQVRKGGINLSCSMPKISVKKLLTESHYKEQGIRKKTISPSSIMEQYELKTSMIDYKKQYNIEKTIKEMFEEITCEEMLQQDQIAKEIRITRNIEFTQHEVVPVPGITNKKGVVTPTVDVFPKSVCSSSTDAGDWNSLFHVKLDLEELKLLWNTNDIQAVYLSKNVSTKDAQFLLSSKYQLAVLDHLQQTFLNLNHSKSHKSFNPKLVGSVESVLTVCNEQESFSEVENYICFDSKEKRLNIIKQLEEFTRNGNFFMNIFNFCLDNVDKGDFIECEDFLSNTHLKAYKKHYSWFVLNKSKEVHTKLLPILNNVTGNQDIYKTLVKAISEQNILLKADVEHHIRSNTLLNKLYDKYIEEVNKPFVWKSILMTQQALTAKLKDGFKFAIHEKGSASMIYREVVARIFKTNVLLYSVDDCNQMVLLHNHNPSADDVVHILIRHNKCFKLKTDEGLHNVIRAHEEKGQVCNKIQLHVESVKEQEAYKEEFDKFISDSPFILNGYEGVSKSTEIRMKIKHMLMEDENIESIANSFELDNDRQLASSRLTMLKHEYVGYQSFLYYIALHMRTEGNQLSVKELCCLINFMLKSVADSSSKTNLVSWIIAAYHQTDWLVEFILFNLELYLKQPLDDKVKISWRKHLRETNRETAILFFEKLGSDESLVKIESVNEVLLLICQVHSYHVGLSQLCLDEWKYYLKDAFWTNQVMNTGSWSGEELKQASYYLVTLENSVGKELCCKFIKTIKDLSNRISSEKDRLMVLNTLELLTYKETLLSDNLLEYLSHADVNKWVDIVLKKSLSSGMNRSLNQLAELIKLSSNTSQHIRTNIDELVKSVEKIEILLNFLKVNSKDESELKIWIVDLLNIFKGNTIPLLEEKSFKTTININDEMSLNLQKMQQAIMKLYDNQSTVLKTPIDFLHSNLDEILIATICASICIKTKITLRNTQLLAIVTFLKSSQNVLGQVSTGEGKSFIILTIAIMKALSGSKVDIITSSHVLAVRDAEKAKTICSMFDIEVGHNCSDKIEERKETYSKCCIVYGELSYFQRDFLLDRVYNNNVVGDRTYETIIVDEVDSMLLDKANNVLYLSHDMPGLDKLVPLFVFIWKRLNLLSNTNMDKEIFNADQLKDQILYEMYGKIKLEDIRNLDMSLEENCVSQTWADLIKQKVIDSNGKVLLEHLNELKLDNIGEDCRGHIKYLLKKVINRKKEFEIPNYLQGFVEDHLEKWIDSGINAINLQNNIDYVVDIDRTVDSADRNPNIIIVDRDTGTDLTNSQWDQGLHQFLQLKHGCRISPLTFKAVFISNVSYLKMYNTLFGLTGTLGSRSDRDLLKDVYKVEFVTIPTAKAKNFTEQMPMLCNSFEDWSTKIVEKVYEVTNTRSALIICDSLSDVFTLKKRFETFMVKNKLPERHVHTYTRDYEEFSIVAESLDIGHVIISTNLAGRGTDIKLSDKLIYNGGLHVCLTFLPNNSRIEEQAFGRSARNGQPGSGQLIFQDYCQNNLSKVIDLKKERDINEILRVSDVKKYYETKIKLEEELFHTFLQKYKSLRDSNHCNEIKEILLMTCLDQWALLLEKSTNSRVSLSVSDLIESISKLNTDDFDTWTCQIQDPFQLIKLGLFYLNKDNEKAEQLFDIVIESEPFFNEAAYYYRACARTSKEEVKNEILIDELKVVEKKLKNRIECSLMSAQFIDYLKNYNSRSILQIDSFKQQQQIVSQTHEIFMCSIRNIIGHPVTPDEFSVITFKCQPEVDHELVSSVIFSDLLEHNIIKQQIKKNIAERDLFFTYEYGICPKSVKTILDSYMVNSGLGVEEFILKCLQKSAVLPSREIFWKDLVSVGILENEDKHVFVNHQQLQKIDPSSAAQIKDLAIDVKLSTTNRVSLYLPDELGQLEDNFKDCYSLFSKEVLKNELGKSKYKWLKRRNIMRFNKQANFSNLLKKTVELNHFDHVTQQDFLTVGIPNATASCIIEDLIQENIIGAKENCDPPKYALLVHYQDIDRIELKRHKAYSSDVKSLLLHCFAFRIAVQKLQHTLPLCEGNYSKLFLPLQINLYRRFWFDLQEQGIVDLTINKDEITSGKLQTIYSKSMTKNRFVEIFSKMYDEEKSEQIVDDLISNEWLKKNYIPNEVRMSIEWFKTQFSPTYSINYKYIGDNEEKVQLANQKKLSKNLQCYAKTIELILLLHLNLSINVKSIEYIINRLAGSINEVETPFLSLKPLEMMLAESRIPTSEINTFTINGFNQVISLEEKKYTKKMIMSVSGITVLALAEIGVGVCLTLLGNPIGGLYFISQGVDDFIFVASCVISGHFSLRSYMLNKIISIVTTSLSCFNALRSTFAAKSSGLSLSTMKENCLQALSNAKSSVKNMFGPTNKITKSEFITHLCKRVVVHAAEGMAYGASFALIDRVIQSQVEYLDDFLTNLVHSDIDNTITNHPVCESAIALFKKLGKKKTDIIIKKSLNRINHRHQVKLEQSFESIDLRFIRTLIERTISKGLNNKPSLSKAANILQGFQNVCTVIKSARTHFNEISTLVCDILNDIQSELQLELTNFREVQYRQEVEHAELEEFGHEVIKEIQNNIKNVFSEHIRRKWLSPVLQFVGGCFEKHSAQMISKVRKSFLTDKEVCNLNKNKKQDFERKSAKTAMKEQGFFCSQFSEVSCEVLKTRNNKKVLGYLVSQNAPMDVYCLELCCAIIPYALKQEGFRVPALKVELEKNGTKQVFCIGDEREAPTVRINQDANLSSNLKNNPILVKDVFKFLYKSILEHYPDYKGLTATILQEMVLKAIDHYCSFQPSESSTDVENQNFERGWVWKEGKSFEAGKINTEYEIRTPYQHSHCGGGYTFSSKVDVDLRDELTNLRNVQNHVKEGFETALGKINTHIHRIQSCLSSFNLVLDDFAATKHQIAPPPPDKSELFHCYTVQYELVVPVMLKGSNKLIDFNIVLCLKNEIPKNKPQPKSPLGPHIIYEINPASNAKFLDKGLKGHVLLNMDCTITSYSLKDCRVAGELIVASALEKHETLSESAKSISKGSIPISEGSTSNVEIGNVVPSEVDSQASLYGVVHNEAHKECNIIIIGDSLLKYINDYISLPKCHFEVFPHLGPNMLKRKIVSCLGNYHGIKCVLLFLGNDIMKTNIPEQNLASFIVDVIGNIQENIINVKVILCTLTYVKGPSNKYSQKIINTNTILKDYCIRNNLLLVDTNRIISPRDLGKDGFHLNRSGYHKLGKHLSEVCVEYMNQT